MVTDDVTPSCAIISRYAYHCTLAFNKYVENLQMDDQNDHQRAALPLRPNAMSRPPMISTPAMMMGFV